MGYVPNLVWIVTALLLASSSLAADQSADDGDVMLLGEKDIMDVMLESTTHLQDIEELVTEKSTENPIESTTNAVDTKEIKEAIEEMVEKEDPYRTIYYPFQNRERHHDLQLYPYSWQYKYPHRYRPEFAPERPYGIYHPPKYDHPSKYNHQQL